MRLLQSGVDVAVIALWLDHENVETTHGYVEADVAVKERALPKPISAQWRLSRYQPEGNLLRFLAGF